MARSTFEGLSRLRPDARPFVLTRASFAGGQRYAAVWPGDNTADWTSLRQSLPTLMGLGLSGFAFVGSDIGGFAGVPSPELFTRWLQAGVFYPFMRAHTEANTPDQDPWSYGARHEAVNRRAIELRYEMLPHIYNVMEEASRTGIPATAPALPRVPRGPRDLVARGRVPLRRRPARGPRAARGCRRPRGLPAGRAVVRPVDGRGPGGRARDPRPRHPRVPAGLRPRRGVRVPPAGRAVDQRDGGTGPLRPRLSRPPVPRPRSTRTTASRRPIGGARPPAAASSRCGTPRA